MRSPVRFSSWAVAAGLCLCPALARGEDAPKPYPACDRTPTQGDVSAAKGAFDAGNGSFNEADYDRAIMYWEDAYRRDCTAHPLLLNLARAYELNGQKQHAVNALQTFLARVPNSSEEGQIRRRIEKLQEQIQSEAQTAPPPASPTSTEPAQTAPPPTPASTTPPPPPAESHESSGHRPITPLIVGGAGLVLTVVSGIIWIGANSDISDFEKLCPGRVCDLDASHAGNTQAVIAQRQKAETDGNSAITRRNISGALALVGIGAMLGGGIWYAFSKPAETASATPRGFTATVTPALAPGYGGMALSGAF